MIIYNWAFTTFEAYPQHAGETDVVFTIHYRFEGVDGDYKASIFNYVGVTYEEGDPFTPFQELTPEIVTSWVEEALGNEWIDAAKANISNQISEQKNPSKVILNAPWA